MEQARIADVMSKNVVTLQKHHTIDHARHVFERNHLHAAPVVDPAGEPVGIVSATDLLRAGADGAQVTSVMTERVYRLPRYDAVSAAARVMRKHKIHHVVVTHEQKVVGIVSSMDLLALVEGRRWVPKNT